MTSSRVYKNIPVSEVTDGHFSLVPIRDEDKHPIMQWRNEQIDVLRQKSTLTKEDQEKYFRNVIDKLFDVEKPDQLIFSFLENGKLIGYGGLVHIDWQSGNGEISFLTETSRNKSKEQFKADWTIYLGLLKRVTQLYLKFFKIYTYAYDVRPWLIETLVDNRFREEARLQKHISVAGVLRDVLIHSYFFDDLSLRPATEADLMLYFDWANDAGVRHNSFNQEPVDLDTHRKWFSGKLSNTRTSMFVANLNNIPVGQIRFDEVLDGTFEIGFLLDTNYRGRNLGSRILQAGVSELLRTGKDVKEIRGKVKNNNKASLQSFVSAGFADTGEVEGVITYVLTNTRIR